MIHVIQDPPLDGPANMARDEVLMTRVGTFHLPPTLRLYQWSTPTISLGYFQPYAEYQRLPPPARTLPVVRRLTGGGAILHDREVTYSLVLPASHQLIAKRPARLYEWVHQAVTTTLAPLGITATFCGTSDDSNPTRGPFFCFQRRHQYDLLIHGDKIVGSAQRRTRLALLQHGSIILGNRFEQQPTARLVIPFDKAVEHIRGTLADAFKELTGQQLTPGCWSDADLKVADGLASKYAGAEWTRRS